MGVNTAANSVMKPRLEPTFVQFKAGVKVEGLLRRIERVMVQGNPVVRYLIEDGTMQVDPHDDEITAFHATGSFSKFLGTAQINEHLRLPDVDHYVVIKCIGEDMGVGRGGNQMKVFEFKISGGIIEWGPVTIGQAPDGSREIGDEDIGF